MRLSNIRKMNTKGEKRTHIEERKEKENEMKKRKTNENKKKEK